ncbi:MAG: leucine-rich repeat domain-containing protein [Bacteroidales bacterium]|nr:leucine-rich repeat domain-containing protein [Bacteroidales bacterium]
MSLETLKTKVGLLIEKAQSGGGEDFVGVKWLEVDASGYPTKVIIPANLLQTHTLFYMKSSNYGAWQNLKELDYNHCTAHIGEMIAQNCSKLQTIKNIENITHILNNAFNSTSLTSITFGEQLRSIGAYAFRYTKLTNVTFPPSVTAINETAFGNITTLTKVIFKGTPTTLHQYAFINCTNLTDIYVPWAEGVVANAPWSATKATIHYNTTFDENGNPIATEV